VRTSFSPRSPASSTPVTVSASNAFPSSINSLTLSEFAASTLDSPYKSPDCSPERDPGSPRENAAVPTRWLFAPVCFLPARAVFLPVVFLPAAFLLVAVFFGADFFANFLGVLFFLASSFVAVTFLLPVLFAFVALFLVFLFFAIRAV
jgi:hypothetical protein